MPERSTSSRTKKRDIEAINTRVSSRIKRTSEFAHNQNILVYGIPGARKTRFCATAPNVLILDINEEGTDSVRRDPNPHAIRVYNWEDFLDIYWFAHSGDHEFKTFAIDGVTGLQGLCMGFVLGERHDLDASRDPDMPSRQAWGKVGKLMRDQITNWRNLPYNTIFTATERSRDLDEEGGDDDEVARQIGPNVSPSIGSALQQAVGTIGRMVKREVIVKNKKTEVTRREVRSRMVVGDSPRYISKDRNGVFGEYIDAPNFTDMLEKIYNSKEA